MTLYVEWVETVLLNVARGSKNISGDIKVIKKRNYFGDANNYGRMFHWHDFVMENVWLVN